MIVLVALVTSPREKLKKRDGKVEKVLKKAEVRESGKIKKGWYHDEREKDGSLKK